MVSSVPFSIAGKPPKKNRWVKHKLAEYKITISEERYDNNPVGKISFNAGFIVHNDRYDLLVDHPMLQVIKTEFDKMQTNIFGFKGPTGI